MFQPIPRVINVSRHHLRLTSSSIAVVRRTYAAAAATKTSSPSTPFQVSDVNGIKVAVRDDGGPTTGLTVVLRAGSRYAPVPGLAHLLDKFAWRVAPIETWLM